MAFKLTIISLGLCCLTACQRADSSICVPLYDPSSWKEIPANLKKDAMSANKCVRKKAYQLGIAEGSEAEIGLAAVRACSDAIELYVLESAEAGLIEPHEVDSVFQSEHDELAKLARSYVIQTRAGSCDQLNESDLEPPSRGVWKG